MSWLVDFLTSTPGVVLTSWIAPFSLLCVDRRQVQVHNLKTIEDIYQEIRKLLMIVLGILYTMYYFMWIVYLIGGRTCTYSNNAYTCDSFTAHVFPLAWIFINYCCILAIVLFIRERVKKKRKRRTIVKHEYELVQKQ